MYQFIETIQIKNQKPQNLFYNQKRVNDTFEKFFPSDFAFQLSQLISNFYVEENQIYKCRIVYSNKVEDVQITKYIPKIHSQFNLVEVHDFDYSYKYKDRTEIERIKSSYKDEIIFVNKNKITDTSYSNLIFKDKESNAWITPKNYLLNGTKRQFLIDNKKIQVREMQVNDLIYYSHFKLINSMLDLEESREYSTEIIRHILD